MYDPFFSILRVKVILLDNQALLQGITELSVSILALVVFLELLADFLLRSIHLSMYLDQTFFNGHPQESNQHKQDENLEEHHGSFELFFLGILKMVPWIVMIIPLIIMIPGKLLSHRLLPSVIQLHEVLLEVPIMLMIVRYVVAVVMIVFLIVSLLAVSVHF